MPGNLNSFTGVSMLVIKAKIEPNLSKIIKFYPKSKVNLLGSLLQLKCDHCQVPVLVSSLPKFL